MKLVKVVGATSEIWQVFIQDSSSTTGAGLAGLAFNTASLAAYFHRDTDTTATAITLATMTVGTFTSSGFKEIDATNMPGWYQFCPPNAALASGAKSCGFMLKGATNMAQLPIEVQLTAGFNLDTANPKVDLDTIKTNPVVNGGTITFPTTATLASTTNLTAGTIATVSGNVNGSVGSVTARVSANTDQLAGQTVTAAAGVTFPTSVASPTNITAGTVTTATNVTTVNGLAANVITATSINADAITAAKVADGTIDAATFAAGAINAAAIAADAITDAKVAADVTIASVTGAVGSVTGLTAADVAAIKAKTDNLPASPAATGDVAAALTATIADSVPADGTRPSIAQGIYMLTQFMLERSVSSTTMTVKKPDGSTTLLTLALDSATTPTSITRAT